MKGVIIGTCLVAVYLWVVIGLIVLAFSIRFNCTSADEYCDSGEAHSLN